MQQTYDGEEKESIIQHKNQRVLKYNKSLLVSSKTLWALSERLFLNWPEFLAQCSLQRLDDQVFSVEFDLSSIRAV